MIWQTYPIIYRVLYIQPVVGLRISEPSTVGIELGDSDWATQIGGGLGMSDVPVVGQKTPQTRGKKKGCKTNTSWNISFQLLVFKGEWMNVRFSLWGSKFQFSHKWRVDDRLRPRMAFQHRIWGHWMVRLPCVGETRYLVGCVRVAYFCWQNVQ